MAGSSDLVMGVDIGGTNTRVMVMDHDRTVFAHKKFPTASWSRAANAVDALAALLRPDLDQDGGRVRAVALGIPAPLDRARETVLSVSFVPSIAHTRLPEMLGARLDAVVVMDKDTNYLLRRDLDWWGKPVGIAIGAYLGTGIGNALWLDGTYYVGAHGAAGELGHTVWPGIDRLCPCGKRGCVETVVSGSALAEWVGGAFPGESVADVFVKHADDPFIGTFVDNFGILVASEANIVDPEVLFLAGGVAMMPGFPKQRLVEAIQRNLRTPQPRDSLEIVYSQDEDGAGALGACLAAMEALKARR